MFKSHAAVALGKSLFPLFALALDLEENWFEDKVKSFFIPVLKLFSTRPADESFSSIHARVTLPSS
jgi:hypothetical protein